VVEARTRRALASAQKYSLVANSVKSSIDIEPEIIVHPGVVEAEQGRCE
jgi:hypothetical protein